MGGDSPESVELLRLIWQEIKALGTSLGGRIDQTNARLDQTNARLDQTNARLDQTNARLEEVRVEFDEKFDALRQAMVEADVRLATEVAALSSDVRTLIAYLKKQRLDEKRLSACETDIAQLKERVAAVESSAN